MTTAHNGNSGPSPRFRIDDRARAVAQYHSGRRFVTMAVLMILAIWGLLYLAFTKWRADYRLRADFGAKVVAATIDPLAKVVPPGVVPAAWEATVAETHELIARLTGSGVLGRSQLEVLRAELAARVARTRPETAILELLHLWSDLWAKAGPVMNDVRYPELFELAIVVEPVATSVPPGIDPADWARALDQTRLMLVAVTASGELDREGVAELGNEFATRLSDTKPGTVRAELARIWDDLAVKLPAVVSRFPRPPLLAQPGAK
jgi:hypothetical protein